MSPAAILRSRIAALTIAALPAMAGAPGDLGGPPPGVVLISATAWDQAGMGSFTMVAHNIGEAEVSLEAPAPMTGARVEVDLGDWDGERWTVDLTPGGSASMTGSRR